MRAKAWAKYDELKSVSVGNMPAWMHEPRKVVEWICQEAGLTIERYFELDKLQKKWPAVVPDWAQEKAKEQEEYLGGREPA